MREVELHYTALRHKIKDVFFIPLFDETKVCQIGPVTQTLHAKLTASMNIDIQTSAQLTIMGNLGDLSSFRESHLTLRNMGFVTVLVDFQAYAELRFGSLNNELAGMWQLCGFTSSLNRAMGLIADLAFKELLLLAPALLFQELSRLGRSSRS